MQARPIHTEMRFGSALSASPETTRAAELVAEQCGQAVGQAPEFAAVFFTAHHAEFADEISAILRRRLDPGVLLGVSAQGVIADATELETSPGIALFAGRLPGARLHAFATDDLPASEDTDASREALAQAVGFGPESRLSMIFADPFSTPLVRLLPGLSAARSSSAPAIVGGLASAGGEPGANALLLNDRVLRSGGVGATFSGNFRVDTILSQGCRPFGPTFVVTKAQRNILFELGGRPALQAISDAVSNLSESERDGLKSGLFVGRVINEYKDRFGRDDFLIRAVVGVDNNRGAVAVAEPQMQVGQTIRLHMRDAATAHEDLSLLLDGQRLYDRPAGIMLITCNNRGRRLFDTPNHDAGLVSRAFSPADPGEERAKPGRPFGASRPSVPLAGFFAAGEIGPIAGQVFLHGQTACAAIFRA